jgi:peroxiredoxin
VHLAISASAVLLALVVAAIVAEVRFSHANAAPQLGTVASLGFTRPAFHVAPKTDLATLEPYGTTNHLALTSLRGRPVVLNFWSSTCTVCSSEAPALRAAWLRLRDTVDFVGVDVVDQNAAAISFVHRTGADWPMLVDPEAALADAWGVPGLPVTFFIDAKGSVVGENLGALSEKQLLGFARSLLGAEPRR